MLFLCARLILTSFLMLLTDGKILLHVIGGSQDDGNSLVDGGGLDVQNVHGARGGHASGLLHDVRHGVTLVQQPQLRSRNWSKLIRRFMANNLIFTAI